MIDNDVQIPKKMMEKGYGAGRRKYDFTGLKHGASIHCRNEDVAKSVRQSYRSYAERRGISLFTLKQGKVDDTDPRGAGYRIWFLSNAEQAKPAEDGPWAEPKPDTAIW